MTDRQSGAEDLERWGLVLAGGEGVRLRPLTRAISGDERPKQFCAVLDGQTLLEQTRRRLALEVSPARTLLVLTQRHQRFYRPLLRGVPRGCAVVQPRDRGTAAAILYGLQRIATVAPTAAVAISPSDHWVSDDAGFMGQVAAAFTALRARPDLVVLLGVQPASAEPEYGWIEGGEPIPGTPLVRVVRFVEKPSAPAARALLEQGCLWNSFVMVGRVPAFLAMIRHAAPRLDVAFAAVRGALAGPREGDAVRALYERLSPLGFSDGVLSGRPANLAVLPVRGVQWSDWGAPARVMATLAGLGVTPAWARASTVRSA
jgi:mannose-1-phosphate guanylyltransferase